MQGEFNYKDFLRKKTKKQNPSVGSGLCLHADGRRQRNFGFIRCDAESQYLLPASGEPSTLNYHTCAWGVK